MKFLVLLILTVSCASYKPGNEKINSRSYQNRAALGHNFFEAKNLNQDEVNSLLTRKLIIPKDIKIAVFKIGHEWDLSTFADFKYHREQSVVVSKANAEAIEKIRGKDKRIKEIAFVPQILVPNDPTLENMRKVAAVMQADFLLVLKTRSQTDSNFNIIKANEVKAVATMEAMMVDVRTGVIPFTTIASQMSHVKEDKEFSYEELYLKATLLAEDKAMTEVFENVGSHFN